MFNLGYTDIQDIQAQMDLWPKWNNVKSISSVHNQAEMKSRQKLAGHEAIHLQGGSQV